MNKTPGLFGYQILPRDLQEILYNAGWKDPLSMVRMGATVDAESDRYSGAIGKVNSNGSQDWGAFQLNNYHWHDFSDSEEDFYMLCIDPVRAATAARALFDKAKRSGGTGFEPWFAYGTQRWHDRLPTASRGLCNFTAVKLYGVPIL